MQAFNVKRLKELEEENRRLTGFLNAYIERFNRSYRNGALDCYLFNNLNEASTLTEDWIKVYNTERPHDSLNDITATEYRPMI